MDSGGFEPSSNHTSNEMSFNATSSDGNMFVNPEDVEETERTPSKKRKETESSSSSSFDDSDCETEYPDSDPDVVSHVFGDFFRLRTKKLKPEWKKYIQPLMWKCRWLELQIKKCNLQALKYKKELAAYNLRKNVFESGNFSNEEGLCAKSIPFSADWPRDKTMRRKRRRKIENRPEMAPYVSNLILHEEGTHNRARMELDDDDEEGDERLWLSGDVNDSLEGVLRKIESLKSRINNMRTRVNKAEEGERIYNETLKKEMNNLYEDLIQSMKRATDDDDDEYEPPITVLDELEPELQPSCNNNNNNEPAPKIRSLAQIIAPAECAKRRGSRIRASSSRLNL